MRKVLYFIALLTCILSINCGLTQYKYTYTNNHAPAASYPKRIIPIYIDKSFSDQDKLSIDNAIGQWNYVLNGQIILHVNSYEFDMEPEVIRRAQQENAFLFLKVNSDFPGIPDDMPQQLCKVTPKCQLTLAWVDRIGGSVMKIVRDRVGSADIQYIALHEIGHLLYLQHVNKKESLMYPTYNRFGYLCIDYESALKVSKTYGLDFQYMNYCNAKY